MVKSTEQKNFTKNARDGPTRNATCMNIRRFALLTFWFLNENIDFRMGSALDITQAAVSVLGTNHAFVSQPWNGTASTDELLLATGFQAPVPSRSDAGFLLR